MLIGMRYHQLFCSILIISFLVWKAEYALSRGGSTRTKLSMEAKYVIVII